jgi:hypothetical protein
MLCLKGNPFMFTMQVLLEIDVYRAQFLENWYVGDPDDQEDTDFDDDLEVRGRASGTISITVELGDCEELSEHLESEETIASLGEWINEVYSGSWSSEIANLEQNVSESQVPRDRDDETLSWATIDLTSEGSIESIRLSTVDESSTSQLAWKAVFSGEDNHFVETRDGDEAKRISHGEICKSLSQALKLFS